MIILSIIFTISLLHFLFHDKVLDSIYRITVNDTDWNKL